MTRTSQGPMLIVPKNIRCMHRETALQLGANLCLAIESLSRGTIAADCALSVGIRGEAGKTHINVFADEYPGQNQDDLGELIAWAEQVINQIIPAIYDATVMYAGENDNEATIIAEREGTK